MMKPPSGGFRFGNIMYFLVMAVMTSVTVVDVSARVYSGGMSQRVVYTRYGQYKGEIVQFNDPSLRPVEKYSGLEYASLLGGTLRFMPPTSPMEKWNGVRRAVNDKPVCPQKQLDERKLEQTLPKKQVDHLKKIAPFIRQQTEDCLNLNLYVPVGDPNDTSSDAMPVMVFIHGESYETGTGNAYDGSVLASYGKVIVVTLNYRMGVLGFMSTGEGDTSGNYAILDQMAAMHWLRENIQSFGGDPDRVTLFGHGYGAALVNILLVSPVTKEYRKQHGPLFQRAILQSGSAMSTWAVAIDPVECTQRLATKVNCSAFVDDPTLLQGCLRNKSYVDLVNAAPLAPKYYSCFGPAVSPQSSVLPRSVEELHKNPVSIFRTAQLMFGGTKHEAYAYLKQSEIEEGITEERKTQILRTYVHNTFHYHRQKIYEILDHHYTDWDRHVDKHARRDGILELLGDGLYVAPMMQVGNYHAGLADTYLYNFGYSSQTALYPRWSGGVNGDELPYVFGAPLVNGVSPFPSAYSKTERMLSEAIMRFWTNFAKTGNPNLPDAQTSQHAGRVKNRFIDMNWPTYDPVNQEYMSVGKRPKVGHHYRGRKLALWLDLIPKLHRPDGQDPKHHLLENPENMSTFDDHTRLLTKYKDIFPPPPPTAPPTPPPKDDKTMDSILAMTSHGWMFPTDEDQLTLQPEHLTPFPAEGSSENMRNNNSLPAAMAERNSSVPLSITIAVGCSLLFLNILIFAGIYYQRERIKKIKKAREDPDDIRLTRKIEREVAKNMGPESVSLLPTPGGPQAPPGNKPPEDRTNNPKQAVPVRTPQPPTGAFSYTPSSNSQSMQRQSPGRSNPGRGTTALNGSSTPQTLKKDSDRHKPHEIHATFRDGAPPAYNSTTAV